jgi:hypothetical protein
MISQMPKDNSEMFGMRLLVFGKDKDIIDKDNYEFIELCHKHRVHKVHEVSWGIRETKRKLPRTRKNHNEWRKRF